MWELLIISVIVCFIVDVSGIIENIEWWLSKWLNGKVTIPKPFNCSLCMIFWLGLLWITINGHFTLLNVMFVCLFATISEEISNTILIIKNIIHWIQDKIQLLITNNR